MNNSKTPKIVVGVGLVALYATGVAVFMLRGKHDTVVAQSPPAAVSAQMVAAPASPPTAIPEAVDTAAAPIAPAVTDVAKAPEAARPAVTRQPTPRAAEVPVASLPSPRPPAPSNGEDSSPSNAGSNAVSEFPAADTPASEAVTSAEDAPSDEDSQSTETPDNGEQ